MKTDTLEIPVYTSGEYVAPGRYRDIKTGALVRVEQSDELPEGTRIVKYARYFRREDSELENLRAPE